MDLVSIKFPTIWCIDCLNRLRNKGATGAARCYFNFATLGKSRNFHFIQMAVSDAVAGIHPYRTFFARYEVTFLKVFPWSFDSIWSISRPLTYRIVTITGSEPIPSRKTTEFEILGGKTPPKISNSVDLSTSGNFFKYAIKMAFFVIADVEYDSLTFPIRKIKNF